MPVDLLAISLEHHRAGRVRQAESGYRSLLDENPANPDALHWLGVLAMQAGRVPEAIELLERAVALRPDDAAFQHNLAQSYLNFGRASDAVVAFQKANRLDPRSGATFMSLGVALLARRSPGDAPAAVESLRAAQRLGIESAELHHHLCAALTASGAFQEAINEGHRAIKLDVNRVGAYQHLALAYRGKGDVSSAKSCLATLLEMNPDYAFAWHGVATLEAEAGNLEDAVVLLRRAIAAKPDYALAYQGLSQVLTALGRQDEALVASAAAAEVSRGGPPPAPQPPLPQAIAELERKLEQSRQAQDVHFLMAARMGIFPPAQIPQPSVKDLFDGYAKRFDTHLRDALQYRVPEMILDHVTKFPESGKLDIIDLGCGTGLCGQLLKPFAKTLWGVDLSNVMIRKAESLGVYDKLIVGDIVSTLNEQTQPFDLLVAADVLIYLGDLVPALEACLATLRPGGRLIFSVESGEGERYQMSKKTLRFTHSAAYLHRLASIYALTEERFESITVRIEANEPVAGFLVVLRKPATNGSK